MTFASDVDLLAYEPDLARVASFVSQTLMVGTGTLSGSTLTVASGSLFSAGVMPNQLIVLAEPIGGTFAIVDVVDATHLVLSTIHPSIADDPAVPRPPPRPAGTETEEVSFHVRTFWSQRNIATEIILHAAGIDPGDRESIDSILPTRSLSRACALAALHLIFMALSTAHEDAASLTNRAAGYVREFRRMLRGLKIELDTDADGRSEIVRSLSELRTHRS